MSAPPRQQPSSSAHQREAQPQSLTIRSMSPSVAASQMPQLALVLSYAAAVEVEGGRAGTAPFRNAPAELVMPKWSTTAPLW